MSIFKQKVVWITGASSGIGEALVHAFAREGSLIVLSARRKEELERVKKAAGLNDNNALIIPFDLSDTSGAADYSKRIIEKFGRIDILINNGGQSQRAEAMATSETIERQLMEVNYFSAINLSKAVIPYMLGQGTGQVVVISSIAGKFGFYLRSTYSAAKHALHGYFESLRLETEAKGLRILMVCPGKVKTNVSFNAKTADGQAHNRMDESHEHALSAEACASQILNGIKNQEEEILIGGKELLAVKIKRFLPKLFGRIIRKQSPY
ncbi:MAG: SDR family oxidoreductase [Bacteroidetes bacterium]|nr:SDR family oxidoreductase [Bacteroidota bacterium]